MKVKKRRVRSGDEDFFILLPSSALMHCVTLGKSFNLSCSSIRQKDDAYLLHENELIAVCQLLSSLWMNQIEAIYVSVYNFACVFLFGACLCLGAQLLQVNTGYLLGREPLLYISDVMQIIAIRNTQVKGITLIIIISCCCCCYCCCYYYYYSLTLGCRDRTTLKKHGPKKEVLCSWE